MTNELTARFAGVTFNLGGTDYVIPPLSLADTKRLHEKVQAFRQAQDPTHPDSLDLMLDVVHAAVQRNYPTLTRDELEERLDLGNLGAVFRVVLGQLASQPDTGAAA